MPKFDLHLEFFTVLFTPFDDLLSNTQYKIQTIAFSGDKVDSGDVCTMSYQYDGLLNNDKGDCLQTEFYVKYCL